MLYNIHLLRVIAAFSVVYYHLSSFAGLGLKYSFGIFGVDVFFVISGFIIAYIGSNNPQKFLLRRVIRIVPFYWAASFGVFLLAMLAPQLLHQTQPDGSQLTCSLFFLPCANAQGEVTPTLALGWTLNYEMYFYVLFAISLLISSRFVPVICTSLLFFAYLLAGKFSHRIELLAFYADPIVFEFILGIVAYYFLLVLQPHTRSLSRYSILKWALIALIILGFAFLAIIEMRGGWIAPRPVRVGIAAFFIVCAAILLERIFNLAAQNRLVFLLGEASYILYLIHPYIIYGVLRLFIGETSDMHPLSLAVLVMLLLGISGGVAVAIHIFFERPVMRLCRRVLVDPAKNKLSKPLVQS